MTVLRSALNMAQLFRMEGCRLYRSLQFKWSDIDNPDDFFCSHIDPKKSCLPLT